MFVKISKYKQIQIFNYIFLYIINGFVWILNGFRAKEFTPDTISRLNTIYQPELKPYPSLHTTFYTTYHTPTHTPHSHVLFYRISFLVYP